MRSWISCWQGNMIRYTVIDKPNLDECTLVGVDEGGNASYDGADGSSYMYNEDVGGEWWKLEYIEEPTALDILTYSFQEIARVL